MPSVQEDRSSIQLTKAHGQLVATVPQPQATDGTVTAAKPPADLLAGAKSLFKAGRYFEAIKSAGQAAEQQYDSPALHELMSLSMIALGDFRGAAIEAHAVIYYQWSQMPTGDRGIVVAPTVIRESNGAAFATKYDQPLHEGASFDVLQRRGDWLDIRTPDGQNGWIRGKDVEVIRASSIPRREQRHD